MLCGGVFAALLGLGLKRLSNNLKVNLSFLFFSAGITVYGFETYLVLTSQKEIIAKQMSVPYDIRTNMEVLDDLRDSGVEAYPNVNPTQFVNPTHSQFTNLNGLTANKGRIYPLGTISNITTILSNEAGYYPIVETDEHGFNNPKGLYIENNVDIVLTGDSFAEGYSVHSNETISAVLRQLDFSAISVGKGGNGSLIELASLKEYAEPLKPKIVLWLYYRGDLSDLEQEMQSSILRKYLNEDDYSQNLISRQEEIDGVLKNYVQVEWEKEEKKLTKQKREKEERRIISLLVLYKLRSMINLIPTSIPRPTPTSTSKSTHTPIFRNVLQKSNQMVSGWGGKMYFVHLPSYGRYLRGKEDAINYLFRKRDFVMQTATELDIPIIDIHKEVFDPHPDPLSLFPFRMFGHYNAEGYRLVAEAIGKRLEADGYVPMKSKK